MGILERDVGERTREREVRCVEKEKLQHYKKRGNTHRKRSAQERGISVMRREGGIVAVKENFLIHEKTLFRAQETRERGKIEKKREGGSGRKRTMPKKILAQGRIFFF